MYYRSSPWDLEPIDRNMRSTLSGAGVPVLPDEVVSTLYRTRPEDWGGLDRDSECDRISAALSKLMKYAIAEPFVSLADQSCPYPMDLTTIKQRLDNRFYRRASAVESNVNYIYTNARMFNQPESVMVRSASIITTACIKIIRKNTVAMAKHKMCVEGGDETAVGPSTSGAGAKGNETQKRPKVNWPTLNLRYIVTNLHL